MTIKYYVEAEYIKKAYVKYGGVPENEIMLVQSPLGLAGAYISKLTKLPSCDLPEEYKKTAKLLAADNVKVNEDTKEGDT